MKSSGSRSRTRSPMGDITTLLRQLTLRNQQLEQELADAKLAREVKDAEMIEEANAYNESSWTDVSWGKYTWRNEERWWKWVNGEWWTMWIIYNKEREYVKHKWYTWTQWTEK